MDLYEKTLYHQIHPAKLATDWGSALIALGLFWRQVLLAGIGVAVIPSIIATVVLVRWGDLERLKGSPFGRYVRRYMTRSVELVRLAGMVVMSVGAWYHRPAIIVAGLATILLAWARGLFWPTQSA
jgi:hypothetical protein